MMRAIGVSALLLLYYCVACDRSASAGPPSPSRTAEPSAAFLPVPRPSEMAPSATATAPATEPSAPECPPPVHVTGRVLATSWPAYLGKRVSIVCRPVRRIDFTRTLITSDGAKFVVTGSPNVTPCSARTSTFTVIGADVAPVAGKTALPGLLLEDDDGEAPP